MFQMVAGVPAIKSVFQTIRKEESHWLKLRHVAMPSLREAGISSLLDEYMDTALKSGFYY